MGSLARHHSGSRALAALYGRSVKPFVLLATRAEDLPADEEYALFLRYTRMGIALRASAENADRALLLGIPVRRVGTIAWMIAGLLSAMCIYVQSPLIGVPGDATLGFTTLLYGMAEGIVNVRIIPASSAASSIGWYVGATPGYTS